MPTVEERYAAATRYVRDAVTALERQRIGYTTNSSGEVEWYSGREKAAPIRTVSEGITHRWLRARSDEERRTIATEAEALVLQTIEAAPMAGCIRDAGLLDVQTPGSVK